MFDPSSQRRVAEERRWLSATLAEGMSRVELRSSDIVDATRGEEVVVYCLEPASNPDGIALVARGVLHDQAGAWTADIGDLEEVPHYASPEEAVRRDLPADLWDITGVFDHGPKHAEVALCWRDPGQPYEYFVQVFREGGRWFEGSSGN